MLEDLQGEESSSLELWPGEDSREAREAGGEGTSMGRGMREEQGGNSSEMEGGRREEQQGGSSSEGKVVIREELTGSSSDVREIRREGQGGSVSEVGPSQAQPSIRTGGQEEPPVEGEGAGQGLEGQEGQSQFTEFRDRAEIGTEGESTEEEEGGGLPPEGGPGLGGLLLFSTLGGRGQGGQEMEVGGSGGAGGLRKRRKRKAEREPGAVLKRGDVLEYLVEEEEGEGTWFKVEVMAKGKAGGKNRNYINLR